jgi:signal transduction histidine kinase/CheY-like chemotaxis protein
MSRHTHQADAPLARSIREVSEIQRMLASVMTRRGLLLTILFAAFAASAWLIALGANLESEPWWVWMLFPLFFYAAAIQLSLTARKLPWSERRVWRCFSLACLAEGSGELIWAIYDLFGGVPDPFPAPAYIGYFSFSILIIVGFWYCMDRAKSRRVTLVQLGNLAILFSAILLAFLFLFYGFLESPVPLTEAFTSIGYCILALSSFLFGLIVASLRVSSHIRRAMFLVLSGVGMIAVTDYHFAYILLNSSYAKTHLLNSAYLLASCCFIWAGFERNQISVGADTGPSSTDHDERARLWETLLLPIAVAGVLIIALVFRERLTSDLLPYVAGASMFFVASLALRNWWGQQLENQLRSQTIASELQLQATNRDLLNEMQSRVRAEDELRQAQKMEALGQLTGGVAHDFNNLLAVILGNLELANQPNASDDRNRAFLSEAIDAANRGAFLTQRLLALSRKQALNPEPIDVGALLDAMRSLLERTLGKNIQIEIRMHSLTPHCVADYAQLESVLLNLAINARDAMPEGGRLTIEVSEVESGEAPVARDSDASIGTFIVIAIRDTGVGIPEDALERVFEPYFTTKEIGKGTGLGLSMAYGFAQQSAGQIAIESTLDEGTEVRLYLPKTQYQPRKRAEDSCSMLPAGRGERVLVVEDEVALRRFVLTQLEQLGYAVIAVADGEQALASLDGAEQPLDLLLSDVVLPGRFSGFRLADRIKQRCPGIKVLFMSGYAEDVHSKEGSPWPNHELLRKPFHTADLARKIRTTLDG